MSYVDLKVGVPIVGCLLNGEAAESTAHCPKCGRVGVKTVIHAGTCLIVHSGLLQGGTLDPIDFCEIIVSRPATKGE